MTNNNSQLYPVTPLSDQDESNRFIFQGYLLQLGHFYIQRDESPYSFPVPPDSIHPIATEIQQQEALIEAYIDQHPRHASTQVIRQFCKYRSSCHSVEGFDWRKVRIISVLLAHLLIRGCPRCSITNLARDTVKSAMKEPEQIFEVRRLIALMVSEGTLELDEPNKNEAYVDVALGRSLLETLFGGLNCLPFLSQDIIKGVKLRRKAKSGHETAKAIHSLINNTKAQQPVEDFVKDIPLLSPMNMYLQLEQDYGYCGQPAMRRSICLAAYRHVKRLKAIHCQSSSASTIPILTKENVLISGPTGCGKTLLLQLLFGSILKLPYVVIDSTTLSETGYVGGDIENIPTNLIMAANGNVKVAETGIAIFDEFDKLAIQPSSANKSMVSRDGVQRGLLKFIEGQVYQSPLSFEAPSFRSPKTEFNTSNLMIIAAGAFSKWDELTNSRSVSGFSRSDVSAQSFQQHSAHLYEQYGLMRELRGRFGMVCRANELSRDELRRILVNNIITPQVRAFASDGIELVVEEGMIDGLLDQAMATHTGARGLLGAFMAAVEEGHFHSISTDQDRRQIRLYREVNGMSGWVVEKMGRQAG